MILGVDFSSTAVDIVAISDDDDPVPLLTRHLAIGDDDSFEAARNVAAAGMPGSFFDDVWLVGIERPISQSFRTLAVLMRIQGAIIARIPRTVLVHELEPQRWKHLCGLAPMARKSDVAGWAHDQIVAGGMASNQLRGWRIDTFDAYAIARAVRERDRQATDDGQPRPPDGLTPERGEG